MANPKTTATSTIDQYLKDFGDWATEKKFPVEITEAYKKYVSSQKPGQKLEDIATYVKHNSTTLAGTLGIETIKKFNDIYSKVEETIPEQVKLFANTTIQEGKKLLSTATEHGKGMWANVKDFASKNPKGLLTLVGGLIASMFIGAEGIMGMLLPILAIVAAVVVGMASDKDGVFSSAPATVKGPKGPGDAPAKEVTVHIGKEPGIKDVGVELGQFGPERKKPTHKAVLVGLADAKGATFNAVELHDLKGNKVATLKVLRKDEQHKFTMDDKGNITVPQTVLNVELESIKVEATAAVKNLSPTVGPATAKQNMLAGGANGMVTFMLDGKGQLTTDEVKAQTYIAGERIGGKVFAYNAAFKDTSGQFPKSGGYIATERVGGKGLVFSPDKDGNINLNDEVNKTTLVATQNFVQKMHAARIKYEAAVKKEIPLLKDKWKQKLKELNISTDDTVLDKFSTAIASQYEAASFRGVNADSALLELKSLHATKDYASSIAHPDFVKAFKKMHEEAVRKFNTIPTTTVVREAATLNDPLAFDVLLKKGTKSEIGGNALTLPKPREENQLGAA